MKTCTKCGEQKQDAAFFCDNSKKDGLYSSCKKCIELTARQSRLEAARRWRQRNPDRMRIYKIAEMARNRKPPRVKDPTARKRARDAWKQKNPAKLVADKARRRAKEFHDTPAWANSFFISEAYSLAKQRTKLLGIKWHVDHIVPLRHPLVCGLHTHHNLAVIPAVENYRKSNRHWPDMPSAERMAA